MKRFKYFFIPLVIVCVCWTAVALAAKKSRLDVILERGYILVGTTGDYKPFSYLNPQTGDYEGHDIDAAKMLAAAMGVEVIFVQTTWKTLVEGVLKGRYDVAMCGITRTLSRQKQVGTPACTLLASYRLDRTLPTALRPSCHQKHPVACSGCR